MKIFSTLNVYVTTLLRDVNYRIFPKNNYITEKSQKCIFKNILELTVSYQHGPIWGKNNIIPGLRFCEMVSMKTRYNIGEYR